MAAGVGQRAGVDSILAAAQRMRMTANETIALLATAWVESSFNPAAVGDNGTSFGLYQHHVGGAGGPTVQSARAYLVPGRSASEAAARFKSAGVTTGAGAAASQRPADRAGYARKVDGVIASIKAGTFAPLAGLTPRGGNGLGSSSSSSPAGGKIVEVIGPLDGPSADHMDHVHVSIEGGPGDPTLAWIASRAAAHGLRQTSGARTPEQNAAAGGSPTSHHLTTNTRYEAVDYGGPMSGMQAFNREMRAARGTSGGATAGAGGAGSSLVTVGDGPLGLPSAEALTHGALKVAVVIVGLALAAGLIFAGVNKLTGGAAAGAVGAVIPG